MGKLQVFYPPTDDSAARHYISKETAEFLGMDPSNSPSVDEALIAAVLTAGNACRVNVTVTVGGKAAKAGIRVDGIKTLTGGVCYTDSAGKVMGLATQPTTTLSTPGYVDIPAVSQSVSTPARGTVSAALALAAPVNNVVNTYTSSCTVLFSPYVTGVDVCCIGAGGKGGTGGYGGSQSKEDRYTTMETSSTGGGGGGAGGGSGQVASSTNVSITPNAECNITVGQNGGSSSTLGVNALGGVAGGNGGSGGSASSYDNHTVKVGGSGGVAAAAGSGAARGGNGGKGGDSGSNIHGDEPTIVTADSGAAGSSGSAGSTTSASYWGGTITLKGGNGGSGGGGGGGGAHLVPRHFESKGRGGNPGTNGTTTAGGTGGASVSDTFSSDYGNSSFTSGVGGDGGKPCVPSASCGGGAGGGGACQLGWDDNGVNTWEGGVGGSSAYFSPSATMGAGGNGSGGGGGNGATVSLVSDVGAKNQSGGWGGVGQSTVGAVLIRVHTAQ